MRTNNKLPKHLDVAKFSEAAKLAKNSKREHSNGLDQIEEIDKNDDIYTELFQALSKDHIELDLNKLNLNQEGDLNVIEIIYNTHFMANKAILNQTQPIFYKDGKFQLYTKVEWY